MSRSSGNYQNGASSGDIMSWVVVFICLIAFWPVGLILLLRKISFGSKGKAFTSDNPGERYRQKYQQKYQQYRERAQSRYERYAGRYGYYQQPGPQQSPGQNSRTQAGGTSASGTQAGGAPQAGAQSGGSAALQKPYQSQRTAGQPYYQAPSGQTRTPGAQGPTAAAAAAPGAPDRKKDRADKKHTPAKNLAIALTALSTVLGILGVVFLSSGLGGIAAAGIGASSLGMAIFGGFSLIGAAITALLRGSVLRQIRRFTKYAAVIGDRDVVSVAELAKAVGEPVKKTRKCLEDMLESGYYGDTAYIDGGLESFVTSRDAAEKARDASAVTDKQAAAKQAAATENQYVTIVNELHMLCGQTSDPMICAKIERIEALTVKIFRIVEDAPEKAPQIRRFMNYYLPTTLKLLHSYQTLERQGIDGENITAAKQDIERILDTLAAGFEQQLDNLFKSDKLDISADIDVIENLMEQDGLSGDGGIMRTAGGH